MAKQHFKPSQLALYYSPYCPYCHRVLDTMVELGLKPDLKTGMAKELTLKNTGSSKEFAQELKRGGGKSTVPCLSIEKDGEISWLYESADIAVFLKTCVDI
ncbi:MAG: glutathione S-transferase N-terminal domain-containing protein [Gammaproteobacteria bacterium]|nr:glutathione S-transferase N-terminal domain-containing protein [Gammaproteobacteria bacterium]